MLAGLFLSLHFLPFLQLPFLPVAYYYLTQATWRKIQSLGLATKYKNDDEFRHFVGMLDGIAFLPVADMTTTTGLSWLKSIVPEDGCSLLQYFAETYVEGISRPVGSSGQRDFHRSCGMSTYHFD